MSDDVIRVPFRSTDDSLADVADAARALPAGEDRAVVRGLVLEAAESGMATAGDMLDALGRMTPEARRRLLDRAREHADVPTTAEVSAAAARKVRAPIVYDDAPPRDEIGRALQVCAAPGCKVFLTDPVTGAHAPHAAKRWWCSEHEHLAAPGDLDPWQSRIVIGPGGAFIDLDEQERDAALQAREAERRAAELQARRAARIAEWPALQAEDAAQARALLGDNFKAPKGAQP
jgi:hypothetical protein